MKRTKLFVIVAFVCFLQWVSSCSISNDDKDILTFKDIKEIEYDLNFNYCTLVDEVDGYTVKDFEIKEHTISLSSGEVECNTKNIKIEKGEQTITYRYKDKDYTTTIFILDNVKPTFSKIDNVYTVDKSKNDDIETMKTVIANIKAYDYKGKELPITFDDNTYDLLTVGEYKVKVTATDTKEHTNEIVFLIKVIDSAEEKKQQEQQNTQPIDNGNTEQVTPTPTPQPTPQPLPSTQPSQFFASGEYGGIDGAMNACYSVMNAYGGSCTPAERISDGSWPGYQYTP